MEAEKESVSEHMETDLNDEDDIADDSDTSSEESDIEEETEQNELIEKIQVLEKELEASPFFYDKHVELIRLLRQMKLASKLRSARQQMSKHFPLTEELWLEWLEDEEGDDEFALELLNKAVQDYQSVKLWSELAFRQMRLSNTTSSTEDGAKEVREVFERALSSCALHFTEASLLWGAYRDFEEITRTFLPVSQEPDTLLRVVAAKASQNPNDLVIIEMMTPCDDDDEKCKRVLSLFTRQLCCPLFDLDATYSKYKEVVEGRVDGVVQDHYQRSSALRAKLMPFEKALKEDASLDAFNKYIHYMSTNNPDPNLIVCIYERAIKIHCLQAPLWSSYLDYLTKNLRIDTVLLPVHRRAIRNCPWSVDLWLTFLRALEAAKAPLETVQATFREALSVGFSHSYEYLSLWTCYIDYKRRRISWNSPDRQTEVDSMREAFDEANKHLLTAFSHDGDPNCTLLQYQAFIEAKYLGGMVRARELYNTALKSPLRKQHAPWLQYVQLERCYGDVKSARKVFQTASNAVHEGVEWLLEEFVRFEREEGDLENYEKALEKCQAHLKKIQAKKAKEADAWSKKNQQAGKKDKQKDNRTDKNKSPNKGNNMINKSKQQQREKPPSNKQQTTKKQQQLQQQVSGEAAIATVPDEIKPYQKKRPMMFDRNIAESPVVEKQQSPENHNGGFKVPMAPPPGFAEQAKKKMMMKRSKPDADNDDHDHVDGRDDDGGDVNANKRARRVDENATTTITNYSYTTTTSTTATTTTTTTPSTTPSHSDLCTVFVSNLDYSTTKEHIEEALAEAGPLKEVRLVTNHKGLFKGYAYAEFLNQECVGKALQLDRKSVQGRPMFVSRFKKAGKGEPADANKFKFGDSLEKNKLFVKNLSTAVSKEDLQQLFQTVGEVKDVRVATYRNGHPKGHAYIEFHKEESASQAVLKLDGHVLKDQPISVAISNPPSRNQRAAVTREVAMETSHTPSLGGGKKVMGRKSQLSMLPRVVSNPCSGTPSMNNQDFRNMLLKK